MYFPKEGKTLEYNIAMKDKVSNYLNKYINSEVQYSKIIKNELTIF